MVQAKRRFNWYLVGGLLASAGVIAGVVHYVHGVQLDRHAREMREEVARAEQENRLGDALNALERYLTLNPGHQESLARYGKLLERVADTPIGWSRALAVNEKVLAKDAANHELRHRIIALAMKLNDLQLAHDHLDFLYRNVPDDGTTAARLGDVLLTGGKPDNAIPVYQKSIELQPKQTRAYVRLAAIYLRQKQQIGAENLIDAMVRAQPDRAEVYLDRGYFLQSLGRLEEAAADFTKARELGTKEAGPLLAAAELALARGRFNEAKQLLEQGRDLKPELLAWYRDGGELALLQQQPDTALTWIEAGLKRAPQDPNLWHLRIEASRLKKDFTAAATDIASLRKMPGVPRGLADYLEARLLLQRGETIKAFERLQSLEADRTLGSGLRARAALSLAEASATLGQTDRQLAELRRAINLDPSLRQATVLLGRLLLTRGRIEEARELLFQLTRETEPPAEAFLEYARALVLGNLGLEEDRRNWAEPLAALQRVETLDAFKVEAALIRADIQLAQGNTVEADKTLKLASSDKPKDARLWAARIALARRSGETSRARLLEDDALKAVEDASALHLGTLQAGGLVTSAEIRAATAALDARLPGLPRGQQITVLQALGRSGDPERAAHRLADLSPADGASLVPALELALLGRDASLVERIVTELRKIEGPDSATARFGEAAWLVRTARHQRPDLLEKARPVLQEVIRQRPGWAAPASWLARLEDQSGNPTEAARYYRTAFDLGDRNPGLTLRLLELLLQAEELEAANKVYRQVERALIPAGDLARFGADLARRRNEQARARFLAERAQPPGPPNAAYLRWLASFLGTLGETRDALATVRKAVDLDPVDPDGWVLWVELLMKTKNVLEADKVMVRLTERQPVDLQPVTLAQCEALMGRTGRASAEFDRALKRDPDSIYTLLQAASFHVGQKNFTKAKPLLEQLRRLGPRVPEDRLRWVRQHLATDG